MLKYRKDARATVEAGGFSRPIEAIIFPALAAV
jgi:hypothetical protein